MIVLDCSAAMEIAKETPKGNALVMLMLDGEPVVAPSLFFNEASNAAWKQFAFGDTPRSRCMDLLAMMVSLVDELVPPEGYYEEAFTEACRYGHSAYDFFYLLLAKRNNATLFTVDKKLAQLCEKMGVNVVAEIDF